MSYYVGLMCGTSMDSIDAVLMDFSVRPPRCIETYQQPLPRTLQRQVLHLSIEDRDNAAFESLDHQYGLLFSDAVNTLLKKAKVSPSQVSAIGSHGQTVLHSPDTSPGFSLQLGDINLIAQRTGILTIGDFRNPDIAAGGQGAPLVPPFHQWCFQSKQKARAIVNLGGIANITWLPFAEDEPILGWDIGPANALVDAWAHRFLRQPYDSRGNWAASGNLIGSLFTSFLSEPYFQRPPPKSTGKSLFNLEWIDEHLRALNQDFRAEDVQCTLTHLTARTVASTIQSLGSGAEVILCGGGVYNDFLWTLLAEYLGPSFTISSSEPLGLAPQWVEAGCFAWLAHERLANRAANCPSVTGAKQAVLLGTCSKVPVTYPD